MKKCCKCNTKFKYIEILKSIWNIGGYQYLKCRKCNTSFEIYKYMKIILTILVCMPILFTPLLSKYKNIDIIMFLCSYIIILIFTSPFWINFKIKK